MKTWRPFHRGMMIVAPRLGDGYTKSGLYAPVSAGEKDLTRKTKMVAEVLSTFGTRQVKPGDTVLFQYGAEDELRDSSGESLTFLHERRCLMVR